MPNLKEHYLTRINSVIEQCELIKAQLITCAHAEDTWIAIEDLRQMADDLRDLFK